MIGNVPTTMGTGIASDDADYSSNVSLFPTVAAATAATSASEASSTAVLTRLICYGAMAIINLAGNGLNLAAIMTTPRLQTKTNYILASMLLADLIIGFFLFEYDGVNGFAYFNGGNCKNNVLIAANWTFQKATIYMSWANTLIVGIDRYVAILHPLAYESRMTYSFVKILIVAAWSTAILLASTFWLWFINADMKSCSIVPVMYQALDTAVYVLTSAVLILLYASILRVALQQRAKVQTQDAELAQRCPIGMAPPAPSVSTETQTFSLNFRYIPHRTHRRR